MIVTKYHFNLKENKVSQRSCVCNVKNCKKLTDLFAKLGDIRGRYSYFPTVTESKDPSKAPTPNQCRQQFRFDRSVKLLGVSDVSMVINKDNRKRGKKAENCAAKTRSVANAEESEQKQETAYIANWHYPSQLIQKYMWDPKRRAFSTTWIHKGPTQSYIDNELDNLSGYNPNVDKYPKGCEFKEKAKKDIVYPILPTMRLREGYRDYKLAWEMANQRSWAKALCGGVSPLTPEDNCILEEIDERRSSRLVSQGDPMPTIEEEDEEENETPMNSGKKRPSEPRTDVQRAPKKARRVEPQVRLRRSPRIQDSTNDSPAKNTNSSNKETPTAPKKSISKKSTKKTKSAKKRKSPSPGQKARRGAAYLSASAKSHAKKSKTNQERAEELSDQATIDKIQLEFATAHGPNRIAIQSDVWHAKYKSMAKEYFGFDTWTTVKDIIYCAFELEHEEPTMELLKGRNGLNQFEQALIGLMLMQTKLSLNKIANIFGYQSHSVISEVGKVWKPEWGRIGRYLSILPFIDAETINDFESEKFIKLGLRMVAYIIDGKDFPCDTVRIDRIVNCAQQSTKLGRSAIRIITWGLPCGLTYEHTDGFLGRAGEKALVRLWASNGRLQIPPGFLGLGDKGFKGTGGFYVNLNGVLYPAFLKAGTQFTHEQSGHSLECAQGRYSIEVFYSRVTNLESVAGIIERNHFSYFDDYNNWAHGRANLYRPLQIPANYKEFFGEGLVDP